MLNFGNKEFRNLQEQVLKNAQDIETLKGRQDLRVVIVDELPEVGDPSYIYLVAKDDGESPDVYEEYIWLEDEERYELIGGVSIDLTHYVTLDTEQTVTAAKTFSTDVTVGDGTTAESPKLILKSTDATNQGNWQIHTVQNQQYISLDQIGQGGGGIKISRSSVLPGNDNYITLGNSYYRFKNLVLSGKVDFGSNTFVDIDSSSRMAFTVGNTTRLKLGTENSTYCNANWTPDTSNTYSLGRAGIYWKDLYLTGNISDGTNSVSVANISTKTTSTYASGTFDSNGESTIDISGGEPEGLFIVTAGNCQTFMRLTATMVQNADLAPIAVPCPFVSGGSPITSTLKITRSGTTLTLLLGTSGLHVSADVAWTLVKTNLI